MLPWLLERDNQLVVLVTDGTKKAMTVAEVAYTAAQSLGVTTLNLVEHTMTQKTQASQLKGCIG